MSEVNQQIISWVDEVEPEQRQQRIDFVRQQIGNTLLSRYQDLKADEQIILESLDRLGLPTETEPQPELFLSFDTYVETGIKLIDNKGVWSRLWVALWRKHRDYRMDYDYFKNNPSLTPRERLHQTVKFNNMPDWGKLFSPDGDLSVTRLDPLVRNQNIRDVQRIGNRSIQAARLLVAHFSAEDSDK